MSERWGESMLLEHMNDTFMSKLEALDFRQE